MSNDNQRRVMPEWQRDMVRAVPDSLVRDLVADFRRGPPVRSSLAASTQSEPQRPPSGGGTVDVKPPPGIDIIDRMCIEQDRIERVARLKEKLEAELITRLQSKNE